MANMDEWEDVGGDDWEDVTFDPSTSTVSAPAIPQPKQSKLKLPDTFKMLRQSAVKGAAAIPDMFLNTPENLRNLINIPVGVAATELGYPEYAPEMTDYTTNLTRKSLTGLGAIKPEYEPVTSGQRIADAIVQGATGGLLTGGTNIAPNLINAAAGATSAGVSQGFTEAGYPGLGMAAGLVTAPATMALGNKAAGINQLSRSMQGKNPEEFITQYANQNPLEIQNANITAKSVLAKSGIDYDALTLSAQKQIDDYVTKATAYKAPLNDLQQVARQAVLEANPIPIKGTKGQLTQDPIQQQQERMIADSPIFGGNVKDKLRDDQVKLIANLDKISESHGTKINSANEFGQLLRSFVGGKYKETKKGVSEAYKLAEETTGNLPIELTPKQMAFFTENAGDATVGSMLSNAKNLGIIGTDEAGKLIPLRTTFKNLQKLRSTATAYAKGQGSQAHYGGTLKGEIDELVEQYGSDLYKNAIKLRREQGLTYESGPKSISGILKKSTETDFAIPDEKIFNKVIVNGSLDDVDKLIGFAKSKGNGEQIKQIQAMTTKYLKDSSVSSDGLNVSWSALENAVDKMGGPAKLSVIYGDDKAREIMNLVESARILNKQQSFAAGGSQTYGRLQLAANSLFKLLNIVPGSEAVKATANAAMTASKSNNALSASYGNVKPQSKGTSLDANNLANALMMTERQERQKGQSK